MAFRIGIFFRALVIALVATAIVGEEAVNTKGSPVAFGADVAKVLDIFIHSLYMNRNIFLREIISNGSDALDKIRFMYLTEPKEPKNDAGEAPTLDIRIRVDKEKRQFIMRDGGVGMTKEDLTNNLGSLGSSGTKNFLEKMKDNSEANDGNLIGQFGVGFYSVFLVADRVTVASKHDASDKQWVWESTGDGTYFLYEDERGNTLGRGTELTLQMKRDADEYLDTDKIKEIVHKYSEFIHFPIYVEVTKTEKVPKAKAESDEEEPEADKGEVKEEETEEVTTTEWELINENKPIWTRSPSDITEEEYNQFYKSMTKDYADPLYYTHFSAEGGLVFTSILYIPPRAPGAVYDPTISQNNIRLYVRRVFITDEFRDLLPRYLNFIRGVVDSDDLPLHVSREILQENRILKVIKKNLVRKALTMISDIAENDKKLEGTKKAPTPEEEDEDEEAPVGHKKLTQETYSKFWEEYGKALRLGMIEDGNNRARLTKLLRYRTSRDEKKWVSFQDYTSRMPKSQKAIYYISGESIDKIRQSPVLEDATRRDIEVIFMTDAIDEYVVGHITDFNGKKLINLAKEGASFDEETKKDKAVAAKRKEKYQPLFAWFRDLLAEQVTKVAITKRKTSEPLIISSRQHDMTARMASIIKGQALADKEAAKQTTKRVLELNHLHPLVDEIFKRIQVDPKDRVAEDLALVLFDTANLQNGFDVEDMLAYSRRINRMLRAGVDIAPDAPLIEEDLSQYEVEEEDEEETDKADEAEAEADAADEADL